MLEEREREREKERKREKEKEKRKRKKEREIYRNNSDSQDKMRMCGQHTLIFLNQHAWLIQFQTGRLFSGDIPVEFLRI